MLHDFGTEAGVELAGSKRKRGNGTGEIFVAPIGKTIGQVWRLEVHVRNSVQFRKPIEKCGIQTFAAPGVQAIPLESSSTEDAL